MKFAKWESFLEKHIEGFFNKKFSSKIAPAELFQALKRAGAEKLRTYGTDLLYPNCYDILLAEEDYQRFCAEPFQLELRNAMAKHFIAENVFVNAKLEIRLQKRTRSKNGEITVEAHYTEPCDEGAVPENPESRTIALEREALAELCQDSGSFSLPKGEFPEDELGHFASLKVVEGDEPTSLLFGSNRIVLGRLPSSDFIFTDPNVSRMHAYIAYERHRHILYDAQSCNGTYVNGVPVERACLKVGDLIQCGNTTIQYEVT